MRSNISYAALAVVLAAGTTAANAQTVIPSQPVETVITQQPAQTVQTTETVRTIRPAARSTIRRQVVTTKRTVTTTTPARVATIAANPQPFYEQAPLYDRAPLYDTVAAPATLDETVLNAQPAATTIPAYRYIYQPDRILVVDPNTGMAVQALPR